MKAHRATISDPDEGTCYVWASTKREVRKRARQFLDDCLREADTLEEAVEFEVVTGIDADWLNTYFNRNNG